MRADQMKMERLGRGGEPPSSLEARAGAFLREARTPCGLQATDIEAIARHLARPGRARPGARLVPILVGMAVLLLTGTVTAVAAGWRPGIPFLGSRAGEAELPSRAKARLRPHGDGPAPASAEKPTAPVPVTSPEPRAPARRLAHIEAPPIRATSEKEAPVVEGALSTEARSLAAALARWRHDGQAETALALLTAHERRYPHGALAIETRVARAEILLALSRKDQALAVLDALALANLPRARELETLRGELRAQAGRCREARADLAPVLAGTAGDELDRRARRALEACP